MRSNNNFKLTRTFAASTIALDSSERQTHRGQIGAGDRLYRIQLNQRSSLKVSLDQLNANADLTLLNSQGKTLRTSARSGQASESINRRLAKGTYYVRVSGRRGSYRLQLATAGQGITRSASGDRAALNNPLVQRIVELTNLQRAQAGLAPLKLNPKLSAAAYAHSRDMALNDFFNHRGADGSDVSDRIRKAGYRYFNAGENIAAGYATAEETMEGWMNSPGHRANILFPNVKEIGVGFYFLENDGGNEPYRYYWTQNFATPI